MSHDTCHMSNPCDGPWNMPNNFCFHVFAQKSLIISEIDNIYFLTSAASRELAGSQLKIL